MRCFVGFSECSRLEGDRGAVNKPSLFPSGTKALPCSWAASPLFCNSRSFNHGIALSRAAVAPRDSKFPARSCQTLPAFQGSGGHPSVTRGGCDPWSTFPIFPAPCVRLGSSQMVFHGNDRAPAALHHQSPAKRLMQARQSFPRNIPGVFHISGILWMFRSALPPGFPGRDGQAPFPGNGGRITGNILKLCQGRWRLDNKEKFFPKGMPRLSTEMVES